MQAVIRLLWTLFMLSCPSMMRANLNEINPASVVLQKQDFSQDYQVTVPCAAGMDYDKKYDSSMGCLTEQCGRRVVDGLFSVEDINHLKSIVEKGMQTRPKHGGPTILDINTGFIRDTKGLDNLFAKANAREIYSEEDFTHYGTIISRLREAVMNHFHLSVLSFTTPTFITRLDGNASWSPDGVHDEYWHVHADRNNTDHYHYSGLLYMSNYDEDFTGGLLHFVSPDDHSLAEVTVEPRSGRVVMFTSGSENPHVVERVTSGERFVLSFWFTCNVAKAFEIFLDGKAHVAFSEKTKEKLLAQHQQHKKQQQQQQQQARRQEL